MARILAVLPIVALVACVGPEIQAPVHFVPERAPTDATLVVRDVAMPERVALTSPNVQLAMLSPTSGGSQLLTEVERGLEDGVAQAHVGASVVGERDVTSHGAGPHAFLVKWIVRGYASALDVPGGEIVGWSLLGAITAGLGCIPLAGTRVSTEHRLVVDVELYDVRAAPVVTVAVPATGELVPRYDTSGLRPVLRKEVRVDMRSGVGLGGVGGVQALDFVDAQARELVLRVLAATEDDLTAAIRRVESAPPDTPPPVVPASAEPDSPEVLYTPAFVGPGC